MSKEPTFYQRKDTEQLEKMLAKNQGAIRYWIAKIRGIEEVIEIINGHNQEILEELMRRGPDDK